MLNLENFRKYAISDESVLYNLKGGVSDTYVNAGTNAGKYDHIDKHKEFAWTSKDNDSHPRASFE